MTKRAILAGCILSAGLVTQSKAELIAHYQFDGNLQDTSGSAVSYDLTTAAGTVTYTDVGLPPALHGRKAAVFNGASGARSPGTSDFTTPQVTMAFWIKPESSARSQPFSVHVDASNRWDLDVQALSGGQHPYTWWYTATRPLGTVVGNLPNNTWSHMAFTYDRTTRALKAYLNGVEVASGSLGATVEIVGQLFIGMRGRSTSPGYLTGQMADVRVYSRVLGAEEIDGLYRGPAQLDVFVSDALDGVMVIGQTNEVRVVISNTGGQAAANTTSTLGVPDGLSVVSSNNAPVALAAGASLTNTYEVVAIEDGVYTLTAQAFADGVQSDSVDHTIAVGRRMEFTGYRVVEISGGYVPGKIEPGETIDITVTNRNAGALTLYNVTNSLTADPQFFDIVAQDAVVYAQLDPGEEATTRYRVTVAPSTPSGHYPFAVGNETEEERWDDAFELEIFDLPPPAYDNEWTFEFDVRGTMLADALNSGRSDPPARFAAGFAPVIQTTDRVLRCTGETMAFDSSAVWIDGARLDAGLPAAASGIHYLRYDVQYDFRTPKDDGAVFGVYFTGNAGTRLAGLALGYDPMDGFFDDTKPVGAEVVADAMPLHGTLTAIAEVNLDDQTLKVWYSIDGSIPAQYDLPAAQSPLSGFTLDNLRFHATGTFRPDGSEDTLDVENIRHTVGTVAGGAAWDEIREPLLDTTAPAYLEVDVSDTFGGGMMPGDTTRVTVRVTNFGGAPATDAAGHLEFPSAFTLVGSNTPVQTLGIRRTLESTFDLRADEEGVFSLRARGTSVETNSVEKIYRIGVGRQIRYQDHLIEPVTPPVLPGKIGPGETVDITVWSENVGGIPIHQITNSLVEAQGFTVRALDEASRIYPLLALGETGVTTYRVTAPRPSRTTVYTLRVRNETADDVWEDPLEIEVYVREPRSDFVKVDNALPLNHPQSWLEGVVPGETDRAFFTGLVSADRSVELGADHTWRGLVLRGNTAQWTLTGDHSVRIGSAGVDMSEAGADLRMEHLVELPVSQAWSVGDGRTLTVAGPLYGGTNVDWLKTGGGRLEILDDEGLFAGQLTVSNGTVAVSGQVVTGERPLRFSGGTLSDASSPFLILNPVEVTQESRVHSSAAAVVNRLPGRITGEGRLVKTGPGRLELGQPDVANNFRGGLVVEEGRVDLLHGHAAGAGPLELHQDTWLFTELGGQPDRVHNPIYLAGDATVGTRTEFHTEMLRLYGPITGPGRLTVRGRDVYITNARSSFSGGLDINLSRWLRVDALSCMGTGPIRFVRGNLLIYSGGTLHNDIEFVSNHRIHLFNQSLTLAGPIRGSGSLDLRDSNGDLTLSGDNSGWTGGIIHLRYRKSVTARHPKALGTGPIRIGGAAGADSIRMRFLAGIRTTNEFQIGWTGMDKPVIFDVQRDSDIGPLHTWTAIVGELPRVVKTGPARLRSHGQGSFDALVDVQVGTLELAGGINGPVTVREGAQLVAQGVTGALTVQPGAMLHLTAGLRPSGSVHLGAGSMSRIAASTTNTVGSLRPQAGGTRSLVAEGGIVLDFDAGDGTDPLGRVVPVFQNFTRMEGDGAVVSAHGLPDYYGVDASRLFLDGTVRVTGDAGISTGMIKIDMTAGGVASGTARVRNSGSAARYVTLAPVGDWPAHIRISPSTRTRLAPGEERTLQVTVDATELDEESYRNLLLAVDWSHGVREIIMVCVRVAHASLTIDPGTYELSVPAGDTAMGSVNLVNSGTLPVRYRASRILPDAEFYTQTDTDAPWAVVSSTAQTRITTFENGRSLPRPIGLDFPFFGSRVQEMSVGIDGVLWFDGRPAVRVFSNSLQFKEGMSEITAREEADRLIVTWDRLVQPDTAQQTFQVVLHHGGAITLRYKTILGGWENAAIGLHGASQFIAAQKPPVLAGRTIRFDTPAELGRISIPEMSGTVPAGSTKVLSVHGNATGLGAGDLRTARFEVLLADTSRLAGNLDVTMRVTPAAGDAVVADPSPPGQDPVLVLDAPQRDATGFPHLSWSVGGNGDAFEPRTLGPGEVYQVQWATNLASGAWQTRATVTNQFEYTDKEPMDGPVIFYRIVKEKE